MPRTAKAKSSSKDSTAHLGFEAKLWLAMKRRQDEWARWRCPVDLATRARRVGLRVQHPKQSNSSTRRLAVMNLAIRCI